MTSINRRTFIKLAGVAAAAGAMGVPSPLFAQEEPVRRKWLKALKYTMIPKELPDEEKFKLVKDCGYDGIDGVPHEDFDAAKKQADLAREIGVPIHGLVFGGWHAPLSHPDPQVRKNGVDGMKNALRCAQVMGCSTVLLVPAIVTEEVSYADAYDRSLSHIKNDLVPVAEETVVTIGIENVWNKFLLSPLEFARYIDECESPRVKAYFDIGNVIIFGFAQHWIRTLGDRIVKLDVKDFKRDGYQWKNLLDGDVNWPEVRKALDEIGYEGWITAELDGGGKGYLCDVAERMEKIITAK